MFYCNRKDKTVRIRTTCSHHQAYEHARNQLDVVDWSFTKNEYKQYRKIQTPGVINEFELPVFCPLDNSFMFYTAPIWDQVAVDRISIQNEISIPFVDHDFSQFTNIPFKCVELQFDVFNLILPRGPWTYFANCEKLEIYFSDINEVDDKSRTIMC